MPIWQITAISMIVVLGIPPIRRFLSRVLEKPSGWIKTSLLFLPLAVVTIVPALENIGRGWALILYAATPFILAHVFRNNWLIIVAVWFPVEFGWVDHIYGAPEPVIVGLLALLLIYLVGYRNRNSLFSNGYTFLFTSSDIKHALKGLGLLLIIALPLGLYFEFIQWPPKWPPNEQLVFRLGMIYLYAVAEEVLFRGLIQNDIERWLGKNYLSLGLSAMVFGAAHLNNGVDSLHWTNLNWEYAVLASVAGVVYGLVWRWSGRVTASALTHAGVNLIRLFL